MLKNQKGVGIIGIIVLLAVISVVTSVGWLVWQRQGDDTKENDSTSLKQSSGKDAQSQGVESSVDSIFEGVNYTLLDTAPGSACSGGGRTCYHGNTVFLKMSYPVEKDITTVIKNIGKADWLFDDGERVDTVLNKSDSSDGSINFGIDDSEVSHNYWSWLSSGLSSENKTLYRGNQGMQLYAFSKEQVQTNDDPYYLLASNIGVDGSYDFGSLITKLDDNTYILSVTLGTR